MQFGLVGFHLEYFMIAFDDLWCFNATFNNISAISWRSVLVLEEARVPSEKCEDVVAAALHFNGGRRRTTDHGQASGKFYHLRLRVECTLFCNLQSRVRTHAVLVIGLSELLDTTT